MISYDAHSISAEGQNVTDRTFSHTVGSGKNRILLAASVIEAGDITASVTYGGVALTKVHDIYEAGNAMRVELWYLVNPTSGSANIVVTYGASVVRAFAMGISYTGVHQTLPINVSGEEIDAGTTTPSISVTPTASNTMVVSVIGVGSVTSNLTIGGGLTQRINAGGTAFNFGIAEKAVVTPTSTAMNWTLSGSSDTTMIAVALKPVPNAGGAFILNMI